MSLLHGGDIYSASAEFGIPFEQWLDVSTGLSPYPYPVGEVSPQSFARLPYLRPQFMRAAMDYYGTEQLLASAGSQQLIDALPSCVTRAPVLLPEWGYQEHRAAWQRSGCRVNSYSAFEHNIAVQQIDAALAANPSQHLVVINPNNPTGLCFEPEQLAAWAEQLSPGCVLVVDEAFIDVTPERSVLHQHFCSNMVVLRSFGKFFGLAGVRIGFVAANKLLRQALADHLGPWAVNGPAQEVAVQALEDTLWQREVRSKLLYAQKWLEEQLALVPHHWRGGYPLFATLAMGEDEGYSLQRELAEQGILIRLIDQQSDDLLVRFGLVDPTSSDGERLAMALAAQTHNNYL